MRFNKILRYLITLLKLTFVFLAVLMLIIELLLMLLLYVYCEVRDYDAHRLCTERVTVYVQWNGLCTVTLLDYFDQVYYFHVYILI